MAETRLTVAAHRGASAVAVENTPDAFRRALEAGADVLETDVRATRDGQLVLLHDPTLDRIAGRPERVSDIEWPALRELPVGPPEAKARVCRLAEVYPLVREHRLTDGRRVRLLLDIKQSLSYAEALADSLKGAGVVEQVILGVRSLDDLAALRRALPGAQTLGLGATLDAEWALAEAGVDIVRLWSRWLDGETLRRARSFGRPVWTIGGGSGTGQPPGAATLDDLLTYRRLGLDGVLVNDPALAVRANSVEIDSNGPVPAGQSYN
jgi:glycerophosphoryl diester phosphodiesterase